MNPAHLNYHHLRLFAEVARTGSLRAAAAKLHLSQPTISSQIKALEESLGESLFDRSGRGFRLTPSGRLVMERAVEIFSLGQDMVQALQGQDNKRPLRLNVGITDTLPKLIAWRLIRPALKAFPQLQLSCVEGHAQDLLGSMAAGRLDVLLSDEAAPASFHVKAYNRALGESQVVFCAVPALAKKHSRNFPTSLAGAPLLLPASRTAWRHQIDGWLESNDISPHIVAEFDDAALMKTAAADGLGIIPVAATVLNEATQRYGLLPIGRPVRCGFSSFLITLERTTPHPAVTVMAAASKDAMKVPSLSRTKTKAQS